MLIETETTPNPATLKFLPGRIVMEAGTRDFATPEEAEASPLAEMLFGLGDVEGVFFGKDFVSVTAGPDVYKRQDRSRRLARRRPYPDGGAAQMDGNGAWPSGVRAFSKRINRFNACNVRRRPDEPE